MLMLSQTLDLGSIVLDFHLWVMCLTWMMTISCQSMHGVGKELIIVKFSKLCFLYIFGEIIIPRSRIQ